MQTPLSAAEHEAAHATNAPVATVLLIAGPAAATRLQREVERATSGTFAVAVTTGLPSAAERLRADRFDAVLVDLPGVDAAAAEQVSRIRKLTGTAALVVRGGDPAGTPGLELTADEWIAGSDSDRATAACVRGVVERRWLRDELRWRTGELAESESRFRNIVDRTPDGIVIVSRDGRVRFANPGAERMFGRSPGGLVDELFGVAVVSGETTEMDIVRPAETEPLIAEIHVSGTMWDGSGAQVISLRDITDRKRADEKSQRLQMEQSARELAEKAVHRARLLVDAGATLDASLNADTTLASLAELVVPLLADWCVIDLLEGEVIRRLVGVHSDSGKQPLLEELGTRFPPHAGSSQPAARVLQSRTPELHRELGPESLGALAENEEHAALLARLGTRSTMTVPLEAREKCLGAITFVCAERDFDESDLALAAEIASRAARALDNARLFEDALAANRVKSDFLAVMSHELRTPLTAILGFTDLLLDGIAGTLVEKQKGYLARIRAGATQLLEIIQEILTYAQAEAGREHARPGAILIGELVDEVVAVAGPLIRQKGLELRVEVDQRDATVHTDVGKLRQVALSLLTNAAKFTDCGVVDLRVAVDGDDLTIAVSDTGIGIAAEELEGIFEPFRQVEQGATRRAGGTGLGLSVSRQLAELLGGELTVESIPDQGSTFTLRVSAGGEAREADTRCD